MIDRRTFLGRLALGILPALPIAETFSGTCQAQQAGKVYRVGLLGSATASTAPHLLQAFRQGLRDLGWIEGRNIVIEYRWAEGRLDRLTDLAAACHSDDPYRHDGRWRSGGEWTRGQPGSAGWEYHGAQYHGP